MEISDNINTSEVTGGAHKEKEYPYPSDALTVHSAHFSDPRTGEHIRVKEAEGTTGMSILRRSRDNRKLGIIAEVRRPQVTFTTSSQEDTVVSNFDSAAHTVEKANRIRTSRVTDRGKLEHRERVAQARRSMPDPQAVLSEMVARSLGADGLQVVEDYLNEKLGASGPVDGEDG